MLWVWIAIALGLLCTLVAMVATMKGASIIGLLLAVATSGAFGAAAWFYGKDGFTEKMKVGSKRLDDWLA